MQRRDVLKSLAGLAGICVAPVTAMSAAESVTPAVPIVGEVGPIFVSPEPLEPGSDKERLHSKYCQQLLEFITEHCQLPGHLLIDHAEREALYEAGLLRLGVEHFNGDRWDQRFIFNLIPVRTYDVLDVGDGPFIWPADKPGFQVHHSCGGPGPRGSAGEGEPQRLDMMSPCLTYEEVVSRASLGGYDSSIWPHACNVEAVSPIARRLAKLLLSNPQALYSQYVASGVDTHLSAYHVVKHQWSEFEAEAASMTNMPTDVMARFDLSVDDISRWARRYADMRTDGSRQMYLDCLGKIDEKLRLTIPEFAANLRHVIEH